MNRKSPGSLPPNFLGVLGRHVLKPPDQSKPCRNPGFSSTRPLRIRDNLAMGENAPKASWKIPTHAKRKVVTRKELVARFPHGIIQYSFAGIPVGKWSSRTGSCELYSNWSMKHGQRQFFETGPGVSKRSCVMSVDPNLFRASPCPFLFRAGRHGLPWTVANEDQSPAHFKGHGIHIMRGQLCSKPPPFFLTTLGIGWPKRRPVWHGGGLLL